MSRLPRNTRVRSLSQTLELVTLVRSLAVWDSHFEFTWRDHPEAGNLVAARWAETAAVRPEGKRLISRVELPKSLWVVTADNDNGPVLEILFDAAHARPCFALCWQRDVVLDLVDRIDASGIALAPFTRWLLSQRLVGLERPVDDLLTRGC